MIIISKNIFKLIKSVLMFTMIINQSEKYNCTEFFYIFYASLDSN